MFCVCFCVFVFFIQRTCLDRTILRLTLLFGVEVAFSFNVHFLFKRVSSQIPMTQHKTSTRLD